MTSPHWFARRGGWLDPRAPAVFARYCDVVTERLGNGIAWAVTLNEPNLPRLLSWSMELDVLVPPGTTATVVLPGEAPRRVRPAPSCASRAWRRAKRPARVSPCGPPSTRPQARHRD
jgi:beta-glucosidase/6-phospho-beta-glucosidase/beta-galactosidase